MTVEVGNGAAGSVITAVGFTNSGLSTCTLDGHPGVSFVAGDDGHQVGNAAQRVGTPMLVTLPPGGAARATLRIVQPGTYDPATCQPTPARGFRVFPPDHTASVFVRQPRTACAGTTITQLTISPVQSGPTGR